MEAELDIDVESVDPQYIMEAELDAEVESPVSHDVEEPLPDAVREIFEQFDPLAFQLVEFATDSSCNEVPNRNLLFVDDEDAIVLQFQLG
jgi:hypothetical protein